MGMSYRRYLAGARVYGCLSCRTHLTTIHSMISRVSAARQVLCDGLNDHIHRHSMASMDVPICSKTCKTGWGHDDNVRVLMVNVWQGERY